MTLPTTPPHLAWEGLKVGIFIVVNRNMTHQLKFECSSVKMQVIAGEGLRTIGHGSLNEFNALNAFYISLMSLWLHQ